MSCVTKTDFKSSDSQMSTFSNMGKGGGVWLNDNLSNPSTIKRSLAMKCPQSALILFKWIVNIYSLQLHSNPLHPLNWLTYDTFKSKDDLLPLELWNPGGLGGCHPEKWGVWLLVTASQQVFEPSNVSSSLSRAWITHSLLLQKIGHGRVKQAWFQWLLPNIKLSDLNDDS